MYIVIVSGSFTNSGTRAWIATESKNFTEKSEAVEYARIHGVSKITEVYESEKVFLDGITRKVNRSRTIKV